MRNERAKKLHLVGRNMTQLNISNGMSVLFSYETPVAVYLSNTDTAIQTSKFWSVTTSRHIRTWLGETKATLVPQDTIESLVTV